MKVLLIEDDMYYASTLSNILTNNQINCDVCYYAGEGLELLSSSAYDVVIVDVTLPDMGGNELVKKIRKSNKKEIPIIVLSAAAEVSRKVELFTSGADDYIIKPYVVEELVMRLHNVFRRSKGNFTNTIFIEPGLELDSKAKIITINNQVLDLTATEFALFEYMIINRDNVLRKENIIDKLYCNNFDDIPTRKIVDVLICKIRKKIKNITPDEYVHTRWGLGYCVKSSDRVPDKVIDNNMHSKIINSMDLRLQSDSYLETIVVE